jgi:hypothetical protein
VAAGDTRRRLGAWSAELLGWLAVLGVLAWFQGASVLASARQLLSPERINDDAQQQIFPFFRYLESSAFTTDYIADYYLACYPLGYWGLYAGAARLGIDPTAMSRSLPLLLWLITILGLGATAHKLGGKLAALAAVGLALGSGIYMGRIAGGLPRSFGFPIIAAALVGLAYARVWWCAACVITGALFYPVAGVISGLSLAGLLLLVRYSGLCATRWTWRRRIALLGGTAALAVALLLPSAISCGRFGQVVRPSDTTEFPEAGRGGRFSSESRAPFPGFFKSCQDPLDKSLLGGWRPWATAPRSWLLGGQKQPRNSVNYRATMDLLLFLVLLGGVGLFAFQAAARRVLLLGVASVVGYTVARLVVPFAYLPERYVAYAVPLLGTLAVSTCVGGLIPPSFAPGYRRWVKWAVVGSYVAGLLWFLGGRASPTAGLSVDLRQNGKVLKAIAALPEDAVVAGWPKGLMNRVPYASRRRVLLTHETHQAFHKGYIEEMRRRMRGLLAAYFATSPEPLIALRDELGVTHLLVERQHLGRKAPRYFRPYNDWIAEYRAAAKGQSYELSRQMRTASVLSYKNYELLDLSRIQSPALPAAKE